MQNLPVKISGSSHQICPSPHSPLPIPLSHSPLPIPPTLPPPPSPSPSSYREIITSRFAPEYIPNIPPSVEYLAEEVPVPIPKTDRNQYVCMYYSACFRCTHVYSPSYPGERSPLCVYFLAFFSVQTTRA